MKFTVLNGKVEPVIAHLRKLPADKEFTVTVERYKPRRTIGQNALYWMWIKCIADETGGDKEAIHYTLKNEFLPRENKPVYGGTWIDLPISTSKLDTKQFTDYLDKIQAFAASELGIVLPSPNDGVFESFANYYQDRI